MVFSYAASVALLSLAMFGLWCFLREMWLWLAAPYLFRRPAVSFLVLVKDIEQDIEDMMRCLMMAIDAADTDCEVIVLDCGSGDMTYRIVQRLAGEFSALIPLGGESAPSGVDDALPYCGGALIHLLDTVHRVQPAHFQALACGLLQNSGLRVPAEKI